MAAQLGLKEAMYWEAGEEGRVHCFLCPHGCRIAEGEVGFCRVRQNVSGVLRSLNYERIAAIQMDPIEKKPLFHFHPGAQILSLGTIGCNLACAFCQNWQLSQGESGTRRMSSEEALQLALSTPDNLGIAYTYNEPFIWYEFVRETAERVKAAGLHNVLVTNGYVTEQPLRDLLPYIDAMNVDVKAMGNDFYRELCRGKAAPPRRTVELAHEAGCLVEVTNLVIPNWNDSEQEIRALVDWIAGVGKEVPLHFSRYHPDHQLSEPPTPTETLVKAQEIAREKLQYVYLGNVGGGKGEDTNCPGCGKTVVDREGFSVRRLSVKGGRCEFCDAEVSIVGT